METATIMLSISGESDYAIWKARGVQYSGDLLQALSQVKMPQQSAGGPKTHFVAQFKASILSDRKVSLCLIMFIRKY